MLCLKNLVFSVLKKTTEKITSLRLFSALQSLVNSSKGVFQGKGKNLRGE